MNGSAKQDLKLPPKQRAIREKCFHPSVNFIEFNKQEIEQSIPERYEKIVRTFPHGTAVTTKTQSLTYEALNQMANRVARAITAVRGHGNEPIVLLLDHGVALIAAILGVLKSGKIYVSLEPLHASARAGYILDDIGTGLIVTNNRNISEAKTLARNGCQILNVDEIESGVSPQNLGLSIPPDAVASIMYTSGSTGPPKGIVQNHRNVLHACKSYTNGFHISRKDRLTLLHSCSFNGSVYNFFGALLNGAALFPLDVREEGVHQLVNWLNQNEITIYHSSPITFRHALEDLPSGECVPRLRIIHLSGAAVSNVDVGLYKNYCSPNCILVHRMGVTETATIRWYFIDKKTVIEGTRVPIGFPADHKEAVILDDFREEICDNRAGEIAIRSRYLSLGYWRKPDLTKAKFLPDPDGGDRRIYLTGDLGRMAPDGCLFHLGRNDHRVKVRGYSVGVGEIESALLEHRGIKDAVVVGWESPFGDKRLVAYLVQNELRVLTVTELRDFLKDKLPDYMIPSTFITLSELPRTPNGKVDRTALPAPGEKRPNLAPLFAEPRTLIEGELARIWAEILFVDQVGIHDNFFDLGGHSLAATRVVSRVIKRFQLDVPLQSLFESPTVADMATVITKHQERELTSKDRATSGSPAFSLQATSRDKEIPLSFAQQRLWFLHQLEPDSPVYNQFKALRLRGRLNREALHKALNTIIERHEVLRTTFSIVDGQPAQIVHRPGTVEMSAIGLAGIAIEQREQILERTLQEFVRRPFDLGKAWPLRAALIQQSDEEHLLVLVTHHIASDGWSNSILFKEISALYEAYCRKNDSPLTNLPVQYTDYAVWQREWLQGEVLQQQLAYWKKQLKDISPLELPTDRPRPAMLRHLGRTKSFTFPQALSEGLKSLSRREGTTLFMTLLAAFQTLLHRYTAQDDIAVGCPVAGRNRVELEGLIGFFVNTLVLCNDLSGNPTFRELLQRVRNTALDAYGHQDVPFEKLVAELQPARDLSRNPFFQVFFQLRDYPAESVSAAGLNIENYELDSNIAKFDLSLGLRDNGNELGGTVEYSTELFDAATIERMLGHYRILMEGIVANPEQRLSELPLLTESERHQLLVEWNDNTSDCPKNKPVHHLFEEQVARSPDALAVVFEDQQLTYRELNQKANRLAHYLRRRGIGPGELVGICVERSLEMIVGLLGILKAGGAYVPLDLSYPAERLKSILNDSRVSVLLTNSSLRELSLSSKDDSGGPPVVTASHITRVCFDRHRSVIEQQSQDNPAAPVQPNDLAYVIYTSGSTGTPKGVAIEHRQTTAFLSWALSVFTQSELRRVFASTSICFDLSVFEIFAGLSSGGTVVVAQNALALSSLPEASTVTLLNTVPSAVSELLNLAAIPPSVHTINLAGEPLSTELVRRIYRSSSVCKVHDLYGPSECTTYSTWTVRMSDAPQTIGRPIANTQVYILDGSLSPVPIGLIGEIYIGGAGVARGYLNRPELTAEKFIPDPFSSDPGGRLYKTGDLARFLPDASIVFLGRTDHQAKIRGYRIEPGEIETVLGQHPTVQSSVVVVREDTPGDKHLVGYMVARPEGSVDVMKVRKHLKQKLPEYMIPSTLVLLDALPLTSNGKINRNALPAPEKSRADTGQSYTAPRTPMEELLALIWADILKVDKVGIHDNFFELGGHSLLAMQILSRIRTTFSTDLPLRCIFEAPTVAETAVLVTGGQGGNTVDLADALCDVEALTDEEAKGKILSINETRHDSPRK